MMDSNNVLSVRLVRQDTARFVFKVPHINSLTISTWQRGFPWRVMGHKSSAWCVIRLKFAAWGVIRRSSVMRDLLLSQRVTCDFPLTFPWWLYETRSRDIKNRWHQPLAFFLVPRPLNFVRSNYNGQGYLLMKLILFHFSVMRDRYPPPHPPLCHPVFTSRSFNLVLLPSGGAGGGGHSFIWSRQVCNSELGTVFRFLSLKQSYTISPFKVLKWAVSICGTQNIFQKI